MTVESSVSRAQYATNGTTGPWTAPFYFLDSADLQVFYTDASGADHTLALDTDYSVTGAGVESGGSVTTTTAYATGGFITIARSVDYTQENEFVDGDGFLAATVNGALDKLTMLAQQCRDIVSRALAFPLSYSGNASLGDAATRKGKLLGFDPTTGNLIFAGPTSGSATDLALQLAGALGSSLLGFLQGGSGAVLRTAQSKLREQRVSVQDFGADPTGVASSTAAFIAASVYAGIGRDVFVPRGHYKIDGQVALLQSQRLVGEGGLRAFKSGLYSQLSTLDIYVGQGATTTAAVLMDLGSGVESICFNWPNQVAATSAAPILFGYAIASDTTKAYFIDDTSVRDVMLVNAYLGISLVKTGRALVENVAGDVLSRGITADAIFDVPRIRNVHFWPFTYAAGTNIGTWKAVNGVAFDLGRMDGAEMYACFGYGYLRGMHFRDMGSGGFWGDLVSCTFDTCSEPVRIDSLVSLSWTGGTLIPPAAIGASCIVTSSDVSLGNGSPHAIFTGVRMHVNAKVGAVISSTGATPGSFTFNGCDFESGGVTVINQGTANVSVSAPKTRFGTLGALTVLGDGANTRIDGVPNPALSTGKTPANFAMQTFVAGVPSGWTFIAGTSANIADQGGGTVRLLLNSAVSSSLRFLLNAELMQRRSLWTMRLGIRYFGVTTASFSIYARRSDTTATQTLHRFTDYCHGNQIFYDLPLLIGYDTGAQSIDIEWATPAGAGAGYIEIAQLSIYECDEPHMRQDVIDSVHRRHYLDPYALGPAIAKPGSNRVVQQAIAIPTAGTWLVNDRILRSPSVVGQPKAWVCTVAGSPGTWVSEGNL